MTHILAAVAVAVTILLGGCTPMANAYVRGVVDQAKTGADNTAAVLGAAECAMTLGAYFRLPDPRHAAGAELLCDPNATLPTAGDDRLTPEQWMAIMDTTRTTEATQ